MLMKVTVSRKALMDGLRTVAPAAAAGAHLAFLECVLIEAGEWGLRLTATNLEVMVQRLVPATVDEAGDMAVPARLLTELVGTLPGDEVTLETGRMQNAAASLTLEVRCGRFESKVKALSAEEFPSRAMDGTPLAQAVVTADALQSMVAQAQIAVAKDVARPVLMGQLVRCEGDKLTMVGADGYRLTLRWEPLQGEYREAVDMIVPRKALDMAAKNADPGTMVVISHVARGGQVVIDLGQTVVRSQLVEGRFPDFTQIIPKEFRVKITVDRQALMRAVKLALLFAKNASDIVKLAVGGDSVVVVGESNEIGDSTTEVPAVVEGEGMGIAFNGHYLVEALGVMVGDQVRLLLNENSGPGVLEDGERYRYVVMPMHLT